jgi:hypothetical protein
MSMDERPSFFETDISEQSSNFIIASELAKPVFFLLPIEEPQLRTATTPQAAYIRGPNSPAPAKLRQRLHNFISFSQPENDSLV